MKRIILTTLIAAGLMVSNVNAYMEDIKYNSNEYIFKINDYIGELNCNLDKNETSLFKGLRAGYIEPELENLKELIGKKPIAGICLGHQLLALTLGGKTSKLKFGHRGGNHPVKDLEENKIFITSQNHGYYVSEMPENMEVTHINLNDNTVEGMRHKELPIYSVQYHPEACPGPKDNDYIFDKFLELV